MDFSQYQSLAARTSAPHLSGIEGVHVSVMGLASEVGEICSEVKKAAEQNRDIDTNKLYEEIGDCYWYLADVATRLGFNTEGCASNNVAKLKKRYPEGFSSEASVQRLDKS